MLAVHRAVLAPSKMAALGLSHTAREPRHRVLAYAIALLGLNILTGYSGQISLGHGAFFAIGAYTYGILTAFQLQPEWSAFWEPFQYVGLVAKMPAESGDGSVVHFTLSFWLALPLAGGLAAFFRELQLR